MLKILFRNTNQLSTVRYHQTLFDFAIGKHAECKHAGPGYPDFVEGEDVVSTIKRLYPKGQHPDWVIGSIDDIPVVRNFRYAVIRVDTHKPHPDEILKRLNDVRCDVLFMRYPYVYHSDKQPTFFFDNFTGKIIFLPFSFDPTVFVPSEKKVWDVCCLGSHSKGVYPLRHDIMARLPNLARKNNWKVLVGTKPKWCKEKGALDRYYATPALRSTSKLGKDYAEALAQSKIMIFDTSTKFYVLKKFFEGMAAGTCMLSDLPQLHKEIHLVPGYNIVTITISNWMDKIKYYLEHDEERETVAANARKTFMKYHTDDIRARELVATLEANT